jgi:hypothetical protein
VKGIAPFAGAAVLLGTVAAITGGEPGQLAAAMALPLLALGAGLRSPVLVSAAAAPPAIGAAAVMAGGGDLGLQAPLLGLLLLGALELGHLALEGERYGLPGGLAALAARALASLLVAAAGFAAAWAALLLGGAALRPGLAAGTALAVGALLAVYTILVSRARQALTA